MHQRVVLFPGRWQPLTKGHKWLIDQALEKGEKVCVGVRDTPRSPSNPYTYEQVREMIRRVYGDRVSVMLIPDIKSINIGRKVGYEIVREDPPAEIYEMSATRARAGEDAMLPAPVAVYTRLLQSTIWFTGMPCSGKTTLAKLLVNEMKTRGYYPVHLDGDFLRGNLCKDLGFSDAARAENLRRVASVAQVLNDQNIPVVASYVSPTNALRNVVQANVKNLRLVHVAATADVCSVRDVKGMWAKAKAGEITGFTGFDAPFEVPADAELRLDTVRHSEAYCLQQLLEHFAI